MCTLEVRSVDLNPKVRDTVNPKGLGFRDMEFKIEGFGVKDVGFRGNPKPPVNP